MDTSNQIVNEEVFNDIFGNNPSKKKTPKRMASNKSYSVLIKEEINEWLIRTKFTDFYNVISERIIGQESLKLVLSNIYNYLCNIVNQNPIQNNMILSAPSGCGKTETYRALKDYFKKEIPSLDIYICDVSGLTANGFRGQDISSVLQPFFLKDIENPFGIVFLDEFDKKLVPVYAGTGENINKEVQSGMLTLIEGGTVTDRRDIVNTHNLMFIGLGSFEQFRNKRGEERRPIGIGASFEESTDTHYKQLLRDEMVEAGASNEIIGRFPYIVNYNKLSDESIDAVIKKTVKEAADEFGLDSLTINEPMIKVLQENANSKYGCRLIKATIKDTLLKGYADALLNKPYDGTLSMEINDIDDTKTVWTKMSKEQESELEASRAEYAEHHHVIKNMLQKDSIWDDNTDGIMI